MIDCLVELAGWLCRLADQPVTLFLPEPLGAAGGPSMMDRFSGPASDQEST